jgi:hypothetical protein
MSFSFIIQDSGKKGTGNIGLVLRVPGNELTRGPPEFVQHFFYGGSSYRRKSAGCPKFDMVWLHRSPIPVRRRGVISSFKLFLLAFATRKGGGRGGGRHPVLDYHCWERNTEDPLCRREKHCRAGRYSHQAEDPGRDPYLQQEEFR